MKLNRPIWVTPTPLGWNNPAWAMMWAVAYLIATVILLGLLGVAILFIRSYN